MTILVVLATCYMPPWPPAQASLSLTLYGYQGLNNRTFVLCTLDESPIDILGMSHPSPISTIG